MNFPKLFLHTISIIDYQWVTRAICRSCDKIGLSVTNSVTKLSLRIASDVTRSSISLVEGKKRLCCSPRKCVTIRWFFHPWKPVYFILKHSNLTCFFQPSSARISLSVFGSVDRCLVWLVYLIHEPDRTSNWSFFFNQNTFFTLNSEITHRVDSQSRKFENYERLMRKPCFPRLFFVFQHSVLNRPESVLFRCFLS